MGLETVTNIKDLNSANPVGASDPKSEGDDHIRNIKKVLLQDISDGLIMTKGAIVATGTANIMVGTFVPAVALGNYVTVMVKPVGQISSVTPTFNANGTGAKTIVKGSNTTLTTADITGANQTLLLQYDTGIGKWILLNPAGGELGAAITSYERAGTFYANTNISGIDVFDVDAVIGLTLESVGPTGSGATNIWTALDALPLSATSVMLNTFNQVFGSTSGDAYSAQVNARKSGVGSTETISQSGFTHRGAGGQESDVSISSMPVGLTAANLFDLNYATAGTSQTATVSISVVGFWA